MNHDPNARSYATWEEACRAQDARIAAAQIAALPETAERTGNAGTHYVATFECCGERESCEDCAQAQAEADRLYL